MPKALIKLLLITLIFISCKKEKEEENIEIPIAIQNIIDKNDCFCNTVIDLYKWQKKPVFMLNSGGSPLCSSSTLPVFFDKDGTIFTLKEGYSKENFFKDSKFQKNIWRCNN